MYDLRVNVQTSKKTITLALLVCFLSIFSVRSFAAQNPVTSADAGTADPNVIRTLGSASLKPDDKLYLDFKRASLLNVLTILAELSNINFVAGKEVADREVNMMLDNVSFEDALEAISRGSNVIYQYIPERNVYLFRTSSVQPETPLLMTKVFKLYYIRATQIREIEGESGSSGGGGTGGTSSGSTFTVLKETTSGGSSGGSGVQPSQILKIVQSILSERGKVEVDDRSNSLVVTDVEERIRLVEQAIAQLDKRLDQVLIGSILIETYEDLDKFLGIEWSNTTTEGTLGVITGSTAETTFPFSVGGKQIGRLPLVPGNFLNKYKREISDPAAANATLGTKDFSDLTVTFKALQDASKLKIIAKPRILVLDNHPALIKITTNEAIGSQTTTAGAEGIASSSNTVERTETGTSLRVTPLIDTENKITMTIEPRFVTSAESATLADTRDPTIRTARTTLMVNSGQTIVLGGLLDSRQTNEERKTPIVGDIPFLGEIFTRRVTNVKDRELMLFLTPSIIRDPSEVQAVTVPDERDRFDDLVAPFWKANKKNWYKKLKKEAELEAKEKETMVDIAARDRLMQEKLQELASKQAAQSAETTTGSQTT